jgi:hypothetical protein
MLCSKLYAGPLRMRLAGDRNRTRLAGALDKIQVSASVVRSQWSVVARSVQRLI